MVRKTLRIVGWGLLVLIIGTVGYQYVAAHHPASERVAMVERGHALYGTLCHECHGDHMEGRHLPTNDLDVPPLNKRGFKVFFYAMPSGMEGFVAGLIGTGRRGMPPFGATLGEADRRALAMYIHAVNVGDVPVP